MSDTPRIQPVVDPTEEQAQLLSKTLLAPGSEPLNLFKVLANYPELMKRVNGLGGMFMAHGSLSKREREMVILRVAWRSHCDYEYAQHYDIAKAAGLSEKEIRDLGLPISDGEWSSADRALLDFADEAIDAATVSDETWDALSTNHSQDQMMELILLVGFYRMLAGFLNAARVPLEEGRPTLR